MPGGSENVTPSLASVSPRSAVTRIVWVAMSRLLCLSSRSTAENTGLPMTTAEQAGGVTWPSETEVAPRATATTTPVRERRPVTEIWRFCLIRG